MANTRTWNHRVVRRYEKVPASLVPLQGEERVWLEVTEVHYRNGKPVAYAVDYRAPTAAIEPWGPVDDEECIAEMRGSMQLMLQALDEPILDQKRDFQRDYSDDPSPRRSSAAKPAGKAKRVATRSRSDRAAG
jgi:hypothetical protein